MDYFRIIGVIFEFPITFSIIKENNRVHCDTKMVKKMEGTLPNTHSREHNEYRKILIENVQSSSPKKRTSEEQYC